MTSPTCVSGYLGMGELNPILSVSETWGRVDLATSGPAAVRSQSCAGCARARSGEMPLAPGDAQLQECNPL